MSKKIHKIVLTGGPAGGKTTLTTKIIKDFSEKGYRVIIVPETATDLISGFGIKPFGNCIEMIPFQEFVFDYQLKKEELAIKAAEMVPEDNVIILYDRGIFDNMAYVGEEEFEKLLKKFNLSYENAFSRYDAVLHMVSSAVGAAQFYNLDNAARTENVEQAAILDKKTMNCWIGHPHMRIIDNSTNFERKLEKAMSEIYSVLGEPVPMEIERKFLIEMPDINLLIEKYNAVASNIVQTYLISNKDGFERRIRQRGKNGDFSYSYTEKKALSGLERIEIERPLTQNEYLDLMTEAAPGYHQILKTRYCFVYNSQYFELDIYTFNNENAILEIELTHKPDDKSKILVPPEIKIIREVTEESAYKNYSLALNGGFPKS